MTNQQMKYRFVSDITNLCIGSNYSSTLRAENHRPTLVLLDPKARIMFISTTQRSGPSITLKSRLIETGLITSKKQ